MINKIKSYYKNDSLKTKVIGSLVSALIIWIITVIFGVLKGLDLQSSIKWSLEILNYKINLFWFLISLMIIFLIINRMNKKVLDKINEMTFSKEQIIKKNELLEKKINSKLNTSLFERFSDVYDYRRLKNHPYHEQYTFNDIESFVTILKEGNKNSNIYKVENGMSGLIIELKEKGQIHTSVKNEIKEEINNCFTDKFIHQKDELNKILDLIKIY